MREVVAEGKLHKHGGMAQAEGSAESWPGDPLAGGGEPLEWPFIPPITTTYTQSALNGGKTCDVTQRTFLAHDKSVVPKESGT